MYVKIGNQNAIETYRDEEGKLVYRDLPGQRVTTFSYPEGTGVFEAYLTTLDGLKRHMTKGAKPAWIESDSPELRKLLVNHFGLKITKANRPAGWGE